MRRFLSQSPILVPLAASLPRSIRSQIPPRPEVTVIAYLDNFGKGARHGIVSHMSLVRTRDNRFWLQRVLPGGETIRWRCIGLDVLKHATSFESYSLNDIDENGGVIIPNEIRPTCQGDPLCFFDAVMEIQKLHAHAKFTRKDRRQWHRRSFCHWSESPEKYGSQVLASYGLLGLFVLWLLVRGSHAYKNKKGFWDNDVYSKDIDEENQAIMRIREFDRNHPEHNSLERKLVLMSPGMDRLGSARAELRESDFMDPHAHSELFWRLRHAYFYGHWPKGLMD